MDDEEFSYSAYSSDTKKQIEERQGVFVDNEEAFSYSDYAEKPKEIVRSYGDVLVEEFSAKQNVPRVAKLTGLPQKVVAYVFSVAYITVGILCVCLTEQITKILPYIVGGLMVAIGVTRFIIALIRKEYRTLETNQTATSLLAAALGVVVILEHLDPDSNWAIVFISIVWGLWGLFEGAHAFNHAFKRIAEHERCIYYLLKGVIECAVAFMLLYQPEAHDIHHFHIIVFGVNLIFNGVTMMPFLKKILAKK